LARKLPFCVSHICFDVLFEILLTRTYDASERCNQVTHENPGITRQQPAISRSHQSGARSRPELKSFQSNPTEKFECLSQITASDNPQDATASRVVK
jgi:hypothetical protein